MVQKTRPVVILSIAFLDHEHAVVTYVPRATLLRHTRFQVPVLSFACPHLLLSTQESPSMNTNGQCFGLSTQLTPLPKFFDSPSRLPSPHHAGRPAERYGWRCLTN
jgi:hypothetical protein